MCPLWPLHYLVLLVVVWLAAVRAVHGLAGRLSPSSLNVPMTTTSSVNFTLFDMLSDVASLSDKATLQIQADDPGIVSISPQEYFLKNAPINEGNWTSSFNVTGNFLGYTSIRLKIKDGERVKDVPLEESGKVVVTRVTTIMDKLFTTSVIVLVSIIFINFGCALDVPLLKRAIMRPIGPLIGLMAHFLLLPLISYGMGLLLFPESKALRLGLFFTGISPAGGASNIWTYTLGGNLNLSVTMTAVSTLFSLAMIPLWAFTLGQVILNGSGQGNIAVPHIRIITSAVGLLVPLAIGYCIQVYCKRAAAVAVRILKPFSSALILFIIVFAIFTNLYLFKLFTWQILLGGIGLPALGYMVGWLLATIMGQPMADTLAIAIETGVQNTGVAIFLLRTSLPQPAADLTTVMPVSVALMTPVPLILLYVGLRLFGKLKTPLKTPSDTEACLPAPVSTCSDKYFSSDDKY